VGHRYKRFDPFGVGNSVGRSPIRGLNPRLMILFPSGELISANLSAPSYESIAGSTLSKSVRFLCKKLVVQFAVAAVSDRRNLSNQKRAVRDRRYKESNCTTTLAGAGLANGLETV